MSSVSHRQPATHACSEAAKQPGAPRALCYAFESSSLGFDQAHKAIRTINPKGVDCSRCLGVLRKRPQLYAIMLGNLAKTAPDATLQPPVTTAEGARSPEAPKGAPAPDAPSGAPQALRSDERR